MSTNQGGYTAPSNLDKNGWITPPTVPDPENLPEPVGWTLWVRPYPVIQDTKNTSILMPEQDINFMSYVCNVGRVVSIGPCCWTRPEHRNKEGKQFDWAAIGDFIGYPKNAGSRRKYKGVSYVVLVDDELNDILRDPQIFDDDLYTLDIPQEHLEKYNTIYNKKETK